MDAFSALKKTPFASGGQTDAADEGGFYGDDGEATQVDHRQLQEGANFGTGRKSGPYMKVEDIRGRRIA